jgi:RNA recognition motif-containing protein
MTHALSSCFLLCASLCLQGGDKVFSTQVVMDRENGESKGYGFVHYTENAAYRTALDECPEIEIKGRLAKSFPAEDKKKVYVRNLPKEMSEEDLKREMIDIAGKYESINIRGGQETREESTANTTHLHQT